MKREWVGLGIGLRSWKRQGHLTAFRPRSYDTLLYIKTCSCTSTMRRLAGVGICPVSAALWLDCKKCYDELGTHFQIEHFNYLCLIEHRPFCCTTCFHYCTVRSLLLHTVWAVSVCMNSDSLGIDKEKVFVLRRYLTIVFLCQRALEGRIWLFVCVLHLLQCLSDSLCRGGHARTKRLNSSWLYHKFHKFKIAFSAMKQHTSYILDVFLPKVGTVICTRFFTVIDRFWPKKQHGSGREWESFIWVWDGTGYFHGSWTEEVWKYPPPQVTL